MTDGILSQEEIDALLKGENANEMNTGADNKQSFSITDFEEDTLGEIGNITMGTSATTLSTLLRKKVSITTPSVALTTPDRLRSEYPLPYVMVEVAYTEGLWGTNVLIIKEEDACIIADLMMGGDGTSNTTSLSELELSAVGEAMNQMMGSATTSLSSMFNRRIDIAPPALTLVDLGKEAIQLPSSYREMICVKFKMEIENLVNSEIMQIIPVEAVKSMISMLMGTTSEESGLEAVVEEVQQHPVASAPPAYANRTESVSEHRSAAEGWSSPPAYQEPPSTIKKGESYAVQPVQFASLRETPSLETPQNIGLIMDVPLDVSVELGKTRKTIRDILELHQGAIIQLDKLAGEPVDLMVNGKLIAKGEVVVIDENYGIRITAIISPMDRMNKLQ